MTKTSTKIVFFGNERLATGVQTTAPTLQALINGGFTIAAVIVNNENTISRKQRRLEIEELALANNIPVYAPKKLKELQPLLTDLQADVGVLAAYGKIVSSEIIQLFPHGIINIHPSLLPLHRGSIPLESVILAGDSHTGVSLMQLAPEMDAGPVFAQSEVNLTKRESKQELADHLLDIGSAMLLEVLPGIISGEIVSMPQDHTRATYDNLINKTDGILDWNKPAAVLEREVRAFAEWPKSRTTLGSLEVVITKAHVVEESGIVGEIRATKNELIVYSAQKALAIDELVPAGKKTMSASAFLAGYRSQI